MGWRKKGKSKSKCKHGSTISVDGITECSKCKKIIVNLKQVK